MSTDPQCFRILSDWMQNGNVMEYARSNPDVNRLRLVSPLAISARIPALRPMTTLSSLRLCRAPPTFTRWGLFMEISRGYRLSFTTYFASLTSWVGEHSC